MNELHRIYLKVTLFSRVNVGSKSMIKWAYFCLWKCSCFKKRMVLTLWRRLILIKINTLQIGIETMWFIYNAHKLGNKYFSAQLSLINESIYSSILPSILSLTDQNWSSVFILTIGLGCRFFSLLGVRYR